MAVLASGGGTNLQALLDDPRVGPRVALVVSDNPAAGALGRARAKGVSEVCLRPSEYASRGEFDSSLASLLQERAIEHVLLAGFMRILGSAVVRPFSARILNVHPSLLPAFPGAHPVRDALSWGVKVTGVTVHIVDEKVDHGPIVAQHAVPVLADDDEGTLHARIQSVEHEVFPRAARLLIEGKLQIEGRRVLVHEPQGDPL